MDWDDKLSRCYRCTDVQFAGGADKFRYWLGEREGWWVGSMIGYTLVYVMDGRLFYEGKEGRSIMSLHVPSHVGACST